MAKAVLQEIPQAIIEVKSPNGNYTFRVAIEISHTKEERKIEVAFYKRHSLSGKAPEGEQWEFEIKFPEIWSHSYASLLPLQFFEGEFFIPWPEKVADGDDAKRILEAWATTTVYTLQKGKKFVVPFTPEEYSRNKFRDLLYRLKNEEKTYVRSIKFVHLIP